MKHSEYCHRRRVPLEEWECGGICEGCDMAIEYAVRLARTVRQTAVMYVVADCKESAADAARQKAIDGDIEFCDTVVGRTRVTECEAVNGR